MVFLKSASGCSTGLLVLVGTSRGQIVGGVSTECWSFNDLFWRLLPGIATCAEQFVLVREAVGWTAIVCTALALLLEQTSFLLC